MRRRNLALLSMLLGCVGTVAAQGQADNERLVEGVYRITDSAADPAAVLHAVSARLEPYGATAAAGGAGEIILSIPYPAELERADGALQAAVDALSKATPTWSALEKHLAFSGGDRDAALDALCKSIPELKTGLPDLVSAFDKLSAARRDYDPARVADVETTASDSYFDAQRQYDTAEAAFFSRVLPGYSLWEKLDLARDGTDAASQKDLEGLPAKYPLQGAWLKPVLEAQAKAEAAGAARYLKPAAFDMVLRATDRLDFRITISPDQLGPANGKDYQSTLDQLAASGPGAKLTVGGVSARWFAIATSGRDNLGDPGQVVGSYGGKSYLLCYDDSEHTLLHGDPAKKGWLVLAEKTRAVSGAGGLGLPFRLNAQGARFMKTLSGANLHRGMAVLDADGVISAPTLQGVISEDGEIAFESATIGRPLKEIQQQVDAMQAALSGLPVAVVETGK